MMPSFTSALALLSLIPLTLAAPAPAVTPSPTLTSYPADAIQSAVDAGDRDALESALVAVTPTARPTDIADALAKQSSIWAGSSTKTGFYQALATQIADGTGSLLGGLGDTLGAILTGGQPTGDNSHNNINLRWPNSFIYPKAHRDDAPYSMRESELRSAIFIPPTFTYGEKPPVIFVPGTGAYGGINFESNLRKLLTGSDFADPVWLNIPGAQFDDVQNNSEYVAYAIQYISSISRSANVSMITWSQGGMDVQWVLKYWPSTRSKVKDFLAVSPDFKGTVLGNLLCLSPNSDLGLAPCPPSIVQQQATSNLVRTLNSNGGNSAYVPTTTFFSGFFDEIVQPMTGTLASAYMLDERGVGVSNNEVQRVCAGKVAGGFYGHAGVLFHPLTYALIVDALTHEGPGDVSRIDLDKVCGMVASEGLDLDDVLTTSALTGALAVGLLAYPDRRIVEPELREYASV